MLYKNIHLIISFKYTMSHLQMKVHIVNDLILFVQKNHNYRQTIFCNGYKYMCFILNIKNRIQQVFCTLF
jgi:hypothetical protein